MDHEDRGEKIVNLARAMLQQPEAASAPSAYSLKTVVLAALLSAAGAGVTAAVLTDYYRPLNRYEKTELRTLMHYAAKNRLQAVTLIENDFLDQFSVQSLDDLTADQLNKARIYLQKHAGSQG